MVVVPFIPARFDILVEVRADSGSDPLGVPVEGWAEPVSHKVCAVYAPSSSEPFEAGMDRVVADLCVIAPLDFPVKPHDRVIVNGKRFEAVGYPADYSMGPHGWNPGVKLWAFKRVEPAGD